MTEDVAKPPTPMPNTRWFWINLIVICAFAPLATYWFQQHLQLYFTEIVVIGGAFTIWGLVRLIWGLFEKSTQIDAWAESRQLLGSSAVTRLLVVALCLFTVLWATTGSLYLQLEGGGSGEYQVEVVRKTDGSPFVPPTALTAGHAVVGMPSFWQRQKLALQCRIVKPVEFEPRDCDIAPGTSTRVAVPGDFKPKEFHLLRLVPRGALYRTLPQDTDTPVTRYNLVVERGADRVHLPDLRRQSVLMGATAEEMPLVLSLQPSDQYEHFLDTRLRAAGQDPDSASLSAAILSSSLRTLPGLYVKSGDELTIKVQWTHTEQGQTRSGMVQDFPVHYRVTADKVQTLWLPKR
jgi:hypothetical protein